MYQARHAVDLGYVIEVQLMEPALNLFFAVDLEKHEKKGTQLPETLLAARRWVFQHPDFDRRFFESQASLRFVFLGTTREQSVVATRAATYLRRHRREFPEYKVWSDVKEIEYRYLSENGVVYDVEITGIR